MKSTYATNWKAYLGSWKLEFPYWWDKGHSEEEACGTQDNLWLLTWLGIHLHHTGWNHGPDVEWSSSCRRLIFHKSCNWQTPAERKIYFIYVSFVFLTNTMTIYINFFQFCKKPHGAVVKSQCFCLQLEFDPNRLRECAWGWLNLPLFLRQTDYLAPGGGYVACIIKL